jgi:hypothetical protein
MDLKMKIDLDWITMVIQKRQNEPCEIEDGGYFLGNPFILKLGQHLEPMTMNKWSNKIFQSTSANAKETQFSYILNITGKFFLRDDYKEKINDLIKFLKNNNYLFHFTRVDVAVTSEIPFDVIYKKVRKLKIKKMTKVEYSQLERVNYCSIYMSRFSLVCYDKKLQLAKNRDEEYRQKFFKKYKMLGPISRIEIRLKGADTCLPITLSETPIRAAILEARKNLTKRLENSSQVLRMFTFNEA